MKKKILLVATLILSFYSVNLFAQETKTNLIEPEIKSKRAEIDEKTKNVKMFEVSMNSEKLNFDYAEQADFNPETQTIKIVNCKEFTFEGKVVYNSKTTKPKYLEYKLGDDTIYIY